MIFSKYGSLLQPRSMFFIIKISVLAGTLSSGPENFPGGRLEALEVNCGYYVNVHAVIPVRKA
jgi:hypothetical protein